MGTLIGNIAENILPAFLSNAFAVTLFGMFLAIIIPPCKKNKIITAIITVSFALSYLFSVIPMISALSDGMRTIILTVVISATAAILFPINTEGEEN